MWNKIKSRVKGLITEFKRRNLAQHYMMGACIRTFIDRETQKTWSSINGSYILVPDWYIEKEVDEQKLAKIISNSKKKNGAFERQILIDILREFTVIKSCLDDERDRSAIMYLKGELMGIKSCMSKFGYDFYCEGNKWKIKRK